MIVKVKVYFHYLGECPEQVSQPNASKFQVKKRERRVIVTGDSLLRALHASWTHPTGKSAASLGLR